MNPTAARYMWRATPSVTAATWPPNTGPGNTTFTIRPKREPAVLSAICTNAPIWWWIRAAITVYVYRDPISPTNWAPPMPATSVTPEKSTQWATDYLQSMVRSGPPGSASLRGNLLGRPHALPGSPEGIAQTGSGPRSEPP